MKEISTWPLLPRSATGYVSHFGELQGLALTAAPKRLELAPYTVATLARQPTAGNPLVEGSAPGVKAGLDMKYALTPGLTLTATINPDFGQVEADPAVVNLSAFETFFNGLVRGIRGSKRPSVGWVRGLPSSSRTDEVAWGSCGKPHFWAAFQGPCGRVLGVHRSGSFRRPQPASVSDPAQSGYQNLAGLRTGGLPRFRPKTTRSAAC